MKYLMLAAVVVAALIDWSHAHMISEEIPKENSWYELECKPAGTFEYWLLHGQGRAFEVGEYEMEEITIYENGSIIFQSLKMKYAGTHLCVLSNPEDRRKSIVAHPVELHVRPNPSDNLWSEVYETQFLTGLIAALVCFSIFALSCLVYNHRWRPAKTDSDVSPIIENGYDNPAIEAEDSSTKM